MSDEEIENGGQDQVVTDGPVPDTAEVEYVVQRRDRGTDTWEDIATVSAAPRTWRRTVLGKALEKAGVKPENGMEQLELRVLDADSYRVHVVPVVVPEPRFDF